MTIDELIEALEKSHGTDRKMDEAIARFIEWHPNGGKWPRQGPASYWFSDAFGMPKFTSSLDDALSILPDAEIEVTNLYGVARATIHNLGEGEHGPFYGSHECNSLPIAICIAALKAIQSRTTSNAEDR